MERQGLKCLGNRTRTWKWNGKGDADDNSSIGASGEYPGGGAAL